MILFTVYLSTQLSAQNTVVIDSIWEEVGFNSSVEEKIDSLNRLTQKLRFSHAELAEKLALGVLELARTNQYDIGIANALFELGVLARRKQKLKEALKYLEESLVLFKSLGDYDKILDLQVGMSTIYRNRGNTQKAMTFMLEGTRIAEKHNVDELPRLKATIGIMLYTQSKHLEAENYFLEAVEGLKELIRNQKEDSTRLMISYSYLGLIYAELKIFTKSEKYLTQCQQYYLRLGKKFELADIHEKLGILYNRKEEYAKALEYFKKAESVFEERKKRRKLAGIYASLGEAYNNIHNYRSALEYLKKGETIANDIDNVELLEIIQWELIETYEKLGSPTLALKHSHEYIDLSKKILNKETTRSIEEMKVKYETEKKEQQILMLEKDNAVIDAKASLRTTQLYGALGGIAFIFLFSFMLIVLYERRRRDQQLILAQNEEIMDHQDEILRQKDELIFTQEELHRQKIIEHEQKRRLEVNRAWIEGEERERERLAGELHDQVGSMLSTVKLHLQALEVRVDQLTEDTSEQFKFTNDLLDEACRTVRNLSHEVSSGIVSRYGLATALEELKDNTASVVPFDLNLFIFGLEERLSKEVALNLYRIIQELLNNIIKYAEPKEVNISVTRHEDSLNIMVEDDGKGFDTAEAQDRGGLGFRNIETRLNKIGGSWHIDSELGMGTTTIIDVPLV